MLASVLLEAGRRDFLQIREVEISRYYQNSCKIRSLFLISNRTYHFSRGSVYSFGLPVLSRYHFKTILSAPSLR